MRPARDLLAPLLRRWEAGGAMVRRWGPPPSGGGKAKNGTPPRVHPDKQTNSR